MTPVPPWTPEMGATTTRMMSMIESLEKSKIRLGEELSGTEKELQARIDANVKLSSEQANLIVTLIHQKENLERQVADLQKTVHRHDEALYGIEDGKLGLVVETKALRRAIALLMSLSGTAAAVVGYAAHRGWL